MNLRSIVASLAALAALPLGAISLSAPPAQAAPNGCASGALCVYWDTFYRGSKYQFFGSNSSWAAWAIENDDSSWFNNGTSGLSVRVYDDRGTEDPRSASIAETATRSRWPTRTTGARTSG